MEKISINKVLPHIKRKISQSDNSTIYELSNGEILKLFSASYLKLYVMALVNLENKVLSAEDFIITDNIMKPNAAIYFDKGFLAGFKGKKAKGISLDILDRYKTISELTDLERYARIHKNIEEIVKKEKNLVFPDICTASNVFVDSNSNINLVDYDGMQVGPYPSFCVSTIIKDPNDYIDKKKYFKKPLYTKNLDIKSLTALYFIHAFNVNLGKIGEKNVDLGRNFTIEDFFYFIGLDDPNIIKKVSKIFNDNVDNEYLGEDMDKIATDYKMILVPAPTEYGYIKRLIKR